MKNLIAILITIFISNFCYAGIENNSIEQLLQKLKTSSNDTNKVNILSTLTEYYVERNSLQARQYALQGLAIAEKFQLTKETAFLTNQLGFIYLNLGKYDKSIQHHLKAKSLYEALLQQQIKDEYKNGIGRCYNGLGYTSQFLGRFETAIDYHSKALNIFNETDSKNEIAIVYNYFARAYLFHGNPDKAFDYLLKAMDIYKELGDHEQMDVLKGKIGVYYSMNGEYESALECLLKALEMSKKLDLNNQIAHNYNNLGCTYLGMEQPLKALAFFENAQAMYNKIGSVAGVGNSYIEIGDVHRELGNFDEALKNYRESLKIFKKLKYIKKIAITYVSMGHLFRKQGNYDQALETYQNGLRYAQEAKNLRLIQTSAKNLSAIHKKKNDFKEALNYHVLYKEMSDSLFNEKNVKKIAQLEMKYQFDKKQAELEHQQQQKELAYQAEIKQKDIFRNASLIIFGLILVIGFIMFRIYQMKQKDREQKLRNDLNRYMQQALSQQMNPHFIFNTLNSIQNYIHKNDKDSASQYLAKFAKLMRMVLNSSQQFAVPIQDEIDTLNLYMELESLRFKDKFDFTIELDENISSCNYKIPTLLIQPFIENAIKHGLMNKTSKGKIGVKIELGKNGIMCSIEDNGVGRKKAEQIKTSSKYKSLGIELTEKRLDLLGQLYGSSRQTNIIDLIDEHGSAIGTRIVMGVPILN